MRKSILITLLLFSASVVLGNGLSLNSIGTKSIGMGGAFVGLADDYSAIYWNPAGLSQLSGAQVAFFVTDIIPTGTYKLTFPAAMGGATIDTQTKSNHYISPNIMGYFPLLEDEKLTIGLGAYVPAGLGAEWEGKDLAPFSGPAGTAYEWMSKIGVFNISPALAYKLNDKISIGAAVNIFYGMMDMKRPMDTVDMVTDPMNPAPGQDGLVDAQYEESSSGFGFGAGIGVLVKPMDILSLGLSFKTKTTVTFKGTAKNSAFQAYNAYESDFERDIAWPLWVGAGIALTPIENLTLTADVQFSQWSATEEELVTDYKDQVWDMQVDQQGQNKMELKWKDATQIRFGAQYKISEALALRAGYYHDPAPAPDETVNIIFPSITYNSFTFGASYSLGKIGIDFGFEYLSGADREIPFDDAHEMPGTHGMTMIVPSFGISYGF